jgi:hypothetical protein
MSPKTVAILSPSQRREVIRQNVLTLDYEELALLCHCTKRTIKRDVAKWREEGGFEQFLIDEFFNSYPDIKQKFPDKAFDRLCYLLGKTMTRKIEKDVRASLDVRQAIIVKMWKPEDEPAK